MRTARRHRVAAEHASADVRSCVDSPGPSFSVFGPLHQIRDFGALSSCLIPTVDFRCPARPLHRNGAFPMQCWDTPIALPVAVSGSAACPSTAGGPQNGGFGSGLVPSAWPIRSRSRPRRIGPHCRQRSAPESARRATATNRHCRGNKERRAGPRVEVRARRLRARVSSTAPLPLAGPTLTESCVGARESIGANAAPRKAARSIRHRRGPQRKAISASSETHGRLVVARRT